MYKIFYMAKNLPVDEVAPSFFIKTLLSFFLLVSLSDSSSVVLSEPELSPFFRFFCVFFCFFCKQFSVSNIIEC